MPQSNELPVNLLAFNNTLPRIRSIGLFRILQSVENGHGTISKRELFSRMISIAWFTVNFFHVSFGNKI